MTRAFRNLLEVDKLLWNWFTVDVRKCTDQERERVLSFLQNWKGAGAEEVKDDIDQIDAMYLGRPDSFISGKAKGTARWLKDNKIDAYVIFRSRSIRG